MSGNDGESPTTQPAERNSNCCGPSSTRSAIAAVSLTASVPTTPLKARRVRDRRCRGGAHGLLAVVTPYHQTTAGRLAHFRRGRRRHRTCPCRSTTFPRSVDPARRTHHPRTRTPGSSGQGRQGRPAAGAGPTAHRSGSTCPATDGLNLPRLPVGATGSSAVGHPSPTGSRRRQLAFEKGGVAAREINGNRWARSWCDAAGSAASRCVKARWVRLRGLDVGDPRLPQVPWPTPHNSMSRQRI